MSSKLKISCFYFRLLIFFIICQVTQKCIIAKLQLFHADGTEVCVRPAESRLFRPTDEFEDMQAITQSLQVNK